MLRFFEPLLSSTIQVQLCQMSIRPFEIAAKKKVNLLPKIYFYQFMTAAILARNIREIVLDYVPRWCV